MWPASGADVCRDQRVPLAWAAATVQLRRSQTRRTHVWAFRSSQWHRFWHRFWHVLSVSMSRQLLALLKGCWAMSVCRKSYLCCYLVPACLAIWVVMWVVVIGCFCRCTSVPFLVVPRSMGAAKVCQGFVVAVTDYKAQGAAKLRAVSSHGTQGRLLTFATARAWKAIVCMAGSGLNPTDIVVSCCNRTFVQWRCGSEASAYLCFFLFCSFVGGGEFFKGHGPTCCLERGLFDNDGPATSAQWTAVGAYPGNVHMHTRA